MHIKTIYTAIISLTVILLSCQGNGKKETDPDRYIITSAGDTIALSPGTKGLQTMLTEEDVELSGRKIHITIKREADESLPKVACEDDITYLDNRVTITLKDGNKDVVRKEFTKQTFSQYLDTTFTNNAILEGIAFDKTVAQGIKFLASVSYPESDLYVPFSITISIKGNVSIEKADMMDDLEETSEQQ